MTNTEKAALAMRGMLELGVTIEDLYWALAEVAGPTHYFDSMSPDYLREMALKATGQDFNDERLEQLVYELVNDQGLLDAIGDFVHDAARRVIALENPENQA